MCGGVAAGRFCAAKFRTLGVDMPRVSKTCGFHVLYSLPSGSIRHAAVFFIFLARAEANRIGASCAAERLPQARSAHKRASVDPTQPWALLEVVGGAKFACPEVPPWELGRVRLANHIIIVNTARTWRPVAAMRVVDIF